MICFSQLPIIFKRKQLVQSCHSNKPHGIGFLIFLIFTHKFSSENVSSIVIYDVLHKNFETSEIIVLFSCFSVYLENQRLNVL